MKNLILHRCYIKRQVLHKFPVLEVSKLGYDVSRVLIEFSPFPILWTLSNEIVKSSLYFRRMFFSILSFLFRVSTDVNSYRVRLQSIQKVLLKNLVMKINVVQTKAAVEHKHLICQTERCFTLFSVMWGTGGDSHIRFINMGTCCNENGI